MGPRLRLLLGVALIALGFSYQTPFAQAGDEETYFVVTAYYSPLPGQSKYTTGSYAGDIRLNGEGHTTASGKDVFPGLLAGPANYPFGTKLYFEGYGIGSIEDRGGAIVKAGQRGHSYDRIDIWMGYGDEGLRRALTWGSRTIKGKIVVPSAEPTISFGESAIGSLTKLQVNPEESKPEDIIILQDIFTNAGLYEGELDGKYESIKSELIEYQLKKGLISSPTDESAGWYGPKTIAALREEYGNATSTLIEEPKEDFAHFNHRQASEKYKIILEYGDLQVNPDSDSDAIRDLQRLMQQLGEYDGDIDGKYSSIEPSLIDMQIQIGLVKKRDDWGAGYFGNLTKSSLWVYYENENDISIQNDSHNLSSKEQRKLDEVIQRIQSDYSQKYIDGLLSSIDALIPNKKYSKYKDQLKYLRDNL